MKMPIGTALTFGCALLLASCGPQGRADRMEESPRNVPPEAAVTDIDVERTAVERDLLDLREKIDSRIDDVDTRLAGTDVDEQRRAELLRFREELQDRRNQVERARRDVDGSRTDTWDNVKTATNNTVDDIGGWFDEQGDRIDRIFSEEDQINEDDGILED